MSATEQSTRSAPMADIRSFCGLSPILIVLAGLLSGCEGKQAPQAAAAAPPVTVAQPVKRTVTDWDEFTGRFDAVFQVQVRPRVGGFITAVEYRDGAFVSAGDLLYLIDARPFEAIATQASGQLSDARAKSVAAILKSKLSQPGRLVVSGKGAENPIAPNDTEQNKSKNRRVEVSIQRTD